MRRRTGIHEVLGSIIGPATYFSKRFGHEKMSTAIRSVSLIQVGQLSVTGDIIGT